jgi:polyisoprenyl-teichoic acid--peptidoglycan teichoic acid transferase
VLRERTPAATVRSPYPSRSRRHRRRALIAALLSAILPGAGQLYLGRRRRGWLMLLIVALLAVAALVLWLRGPGDLLDLLLRPTVLIGLLAADGALLVLRLLCVGDAYRLGRVAVGRARGRLAGRLGAFAAMTAIVAVTAAPHAAAGYYDLQAHSLLTTVFAEEPTEVAAVTEVGGGDRPRAERSRPAKQPTWPEHDRVTVLLIGGDAGPGRSGLRTDTMIVVSVQPSTGRTALFGLPRNLSRVPLPDGPAARHFPCRCFPQLLNALYRFAETNPSLYPGAANPGATAVIGAAQELLGIPIDHYALVDLGGFVDVVDALDGVTIDVAERVKVELSPPYPGGDWQKFDIQPGRQHLDGREALAYARSRKGTDDYHRMLRQRCLLGALSRQASVTSLLRALPGLVKVVKRSISTDIPTSRLPTLIKMVKRTQRHDPVAIGLAPPRYAAPQAHLEPPVPKLDLIRATVQRALQHPKTFRSAGGAETIGSSCG